MKTNALWTVLWCIVLLIGLTGTGWSAVPPTATPPSAGDGTIANPYQISTLNNLYWITQESDQWSKNYIQTADINASATSSWDDGNGWTPIGNQFTFFTGSYNGLGSTIDGLTIDRSTTNYIGMFGGTNGATIKNLDITNVNITGGDLGIGSLIGTCSSSTVSNCYSSGTVTGGESVGGLIGWNEASTTDNCYSDASANGTSEVGGFIGYHAGSSVINNCYSTGNVTRSSGTEVSFGGFCGHNDGSTINYCYSTGSVIYDGETNPTDKGFIGSETATTSYTYNFFDSDVSNQSTATGATGKTTTEMKNPSTFTGWDFITIWQIVGENYPSLIFPEGSENNPLKITSLADLIALSGTSADWGKYIIQTVDIDASATDDGGSGFSPIGLSSPYFTGTYDGLGHTIDALFIDRASTDYIALFGRTDEAEISNLGLTDVDITGQFQVAGLVGWCASSTISKCFTSGSVTGTSYVGGLIGWHRETLTLTNSYSRASISGNTYVGGLMGTLFYGSRWIGGT